MMQVRFEGGPRDGEREDVLDGTLCLYQVDPAGPPPVCGAVMRLQDWFAYVQTFEPDDDGTEVFRFTTDLHDPMFDVVREMKERRAADDWAAMRERAEIDIVCQYGTL